MLIKSQINSKAGNSRNALKIRERERKQYQIYEHCKAQGHLKDTCFKLHGYPDWYVELLKTKKDRKNIKQVNLTEAVLEPKKHMDGK